jgi:ankyrin repeat protein
MRHAGAAGIALLISVIRLIGAGPDVRLADAAKEMDRASIHTLLRQHIDVNAAQADGSTALHWAAYHDDLELTASLIQAGASVKAANRYGVTPVSLACTNGSAVMIELLLKAGADPNATLPGGETALMTASRTGNPQAVKSLLSHGADANAKESWYSQTALMWAAAEGHSEVVEALIKAGADLRARSSSGFTPLLFAIREGRADVVSKLLKAGADVNDSITTAKERKERWTDSLGAAPKAGTSALTLAVANAHFELAAALLDAGADPNGGDPSSTWTPLHTITWVRKPGVGSNDPAPIGSGNMTSLELVKKLAAHGANLNARPAKRLPLRFSILATQGATPFLLAARSADAELMRTLAALGADTRLANVDNSTPLLVAAGLGTNHPGEDPGTQSEVLEAVQVALDLGNDLNAVDKNGETAMHAAAYKHLPSVVQFLADKGARIEIWNQKDKHGWTPLSIAEGHRIGNFEPSPETAAVLRSLMSASGLPTVAEPGSVSYRETSGNYSERKQSK